MEDKYTVYVRTDEAGRIIEVNSSAFLADTAGWTAIDEGYGDKYHAGGLSMYDNIKKWYAMGLWSAAQVRQAVLKGVISEAQYKEITGEA